MNAFVFAAIIFAANADSDYSTECAALAVFSEARSESWLGQALVAQTVYNRAMRGGKSVCAVVLEPGQFHGVERWPYPREPWNIDAAAWNTAFEVAIAVRTGDYVISPPICAHATHFLRSSSRLPSSWAKLKLLCEVGAHAFYGPEADER